MPGFKLHVSNRTEILLEELAGVVSVPLRSPLEAEVIVVQSKGMERWLAQQLSKRLGIWANCTFPFPNRAISNLFKGILNEVPDDAVYSRDFMAWRILRLLPGSLGRPEFETLRHYLENTSEGLKGFQLAHRIAATFDQYQAFRPDMLLAWETGADQDWQAQLWRLLVRDCQAPHRAANRKQFIERLAAEDFSPDDLPARISIFGTPYLPPFHLEVFSAVSRVLDVHFFFMNPCQEYWGDIVSEKALAGARTRQKRRILNTEELHYEAGNSLLASMGNLGREFFDRLIESEEADESSRFEDPGEHCLLTCLQSDILNLRDRNQEPGKTPISPHDDSLQIHSCHSPMREMEVLYDQLLALFDHHPDLAPRDIIVMAPDIEVYAPFVAAVFGGAFSHTPRIPFSIADRSPKREKPVIQAFLKILDLAGSRLGASQVLDLLESLPVRKNFDLESPDLDMIRHWVESTRIRWGVDGLDRKQQGLPDFEENSWRAGLRRLMLGYALPLEGDRLFEGILPYEDMEGERSQVLGRFAEFLERLIDQVRGFDEPRRLTGWSEALLSLVEDLFASDEETEREVQLLRHLLAKLVVIQEQCHFEEAIGIDVLRCYLEEALAVSDMTYGFLTGGVTFCSLLPMRSIPFRVIALVGMNYDTFPRSDYRVSFDLMARTPRRGDRSSQAEDRYLFLESLLSARDHFYLSFVGQNLSDNSERPPSVLVSELLDAIEQCFQPSEPFRSASEQILVCHPLQAFSPSYFTGGSRLFTYSEENLEAVKARQSNPSTPAPYLASPIGEPAEEWKHLEIQDLKRFFRNPAEYFFRQRLGLHLEDSRTTEDCEPFTLESLDAYHMEQELLEKSLQQEDLARSYLPYRAKGILPAGETGRIVFQDVLTKVQSLAARVQERTRSPKHEPLQIELEIEGFRLTGLIDGLWERHLLRYRCAKIKPKDRLGVWLDHLIVNEVAGQKTPRTSILLGQDGSCTYPFFADSRSILTRLLGFYWKGLREPLPFFPDSAYAYAECVSKRKPETAAIVEALRKWEGSGFGKSPPERNDPYFQLGFGKIAPLDARFRQLAIEIFQPLLAHQQEEEP